MIEERLLVSGKQGRLRINAPLTFKETGLYEVNKVGIAADATGAPMICFKGQKKSLALLANLPGAMRWAQYACVAYPLSRTNLLVTETVGRIEEATDEYIAARNEILAAPMQYASLYPETPPGEPDPMKHQVEAFCHALSGFDRGFNGFGMWASMGTGKTRWACDMLRVLNKRASVVVAQNSTLQQWESWLKRICPNFEIRMLTGMSLKHRATSIRQTSESETSTGDPVCFVINWEAIARLESEFIRLKPDCVVADEATRAKSRTAQMSKALHKIGASTRYRIAMSGSPLANGPEDLWSVYKFIDPSLFERSFWEYMKTNFILGGYSSHEFVGFNPMRLNSFIGKMYESAFRISKGCIGDLPEKTFETVHLEMEPEQRRLYDQLEKDLYAHRVREDGTVQTLSIANALVLVTRLQQVCAGLFPVERDAAAPTQCEVIPSTKTNWIKNYCREAMADTDAQLCIWGRFTKEIEQICQALAQIGLVQGVDFDYIDGSVKVKDRERMRLAYNDRDNPLRILVCQIAAVAYGLDLTGADTLIYATNSFSHLERVQSLERGHRLGRTRAYTIIDLVCKRSIDSKVLEALKKKQNLSDMLLMEGLS